MSEQSAADEDLPPDSLAAFAEDLKAVKNRYPEVSYEIMERRLRRRGLNVSRSSLNNAVKPESLASERTVRGFILALTNDEQLVERWLVRRAALASSDRTESGAESPTGPPTAPHQPSRRWWWAAAVLLVVSNIVTGVLVGFWDRPAGTGAPALLARTGDDPGKTECRHDAKVAVASTAHPMFLLEILFSHTCDAAWARITRYDNAGLGNRLTVVIYRRSDPNGPTRQEAVEPDVGSAYTTLIVRNDPTDRLCASGSASLGDRVETTPQPICT
ncbi:DUF2690 domain-containing protein [Nocardia abscessus]|uniref:DUF2690 domain-containing protein n=1 Tax=Nocardia abscessus TaxID=120957 RepID=UPI0024543EAA|nr:DUF2690 domain-containing protein [Nocardia abscessus]